MINRKAAQAHANTRAVVPVIRVQLLKVQVGDGLVLSALWSEPPKGRRPRCYILHHCRGSGQKNFQWVRRGTSFDAITETITETMNKASSVILVRESEQQLTGSGCCGRLEGGFVKRPNGESIFAEQRAIMEEMGPLYRGLRQRYGDGVELQVLDPRNSSLIVMLIRDFWRYRVGLREALRTLFRIPVQAVVVNGRLIARGCWPELQEVASIVDQRTTEIS